MLALYYMYVALQIMQTYLPKLCAVTNTLLMNSTCDIYTTIHKNTCCYICAYCWPNSVREQCHYSVARQFSHQKLLTVNIVCQVFR